jgi:circadian clock protein KaiC
MTDLDLVLDGGLKPGSLVVLAGAPGTGKTILAQQICFANATPERKAIYYTTLSEPHAKLVSHLEPFTFFDSDALEDSVEFIHLGDLLLNEKGGGLGSVVAEVVDTCFETNPAVVVIDSAKALQVFADDQSLRTAYYELASRVAHTDAVLVLVGEYAPEEIERGVEFALADGIVHLAYEPYEPVDRRRLRVVKLRGANPLAGKHSFRISAEGCEVFPRLETIEPDQAANDVGVRVSSGVPKLDELMGGGIPAGDATAILGPSGCGKTVLGLRFIGQGLADGERCLYASFQESASQLVKKAASFGWDLEGALESGQLVIHHVPHGELNLDTLGAVVRRELSDGSVRRVIFDSLAELVGGRARDGSVSGLRPLADGVHSRGRGVRSRDQRDDRPGPGGRADRRSFVPVQQRAPSPVHRDGLGDPARSQHPEDARQQPRKGRIPVRDRPARL